MNDDDLELLLRMPASSGNIELETRLLRQTSQVIGNRVWRRRAIAAGALAACFAAGLVTAHLALQLQPQRVVDSVVFRPVSRAAPVMIVSLPELELQAEQANDEERAKIYFVAGRRYATERGDWDSALRCYKQGLDAAPTQAEQIDPTTDDWLLIALKIERQKEKDDALRND